MWQQLDGFERRKTPLSDHLLEVMTHWRKSFAGVEANFELLFERFELMGSLAAFHENDEAQLEKAAESIAGRRDVLAWMPMGRAGWNSSGARALLQELDDQARIAELLKAGFAKGSERFFQLFVENFKLYAERMRWG